MITGLRSQRQFRMGGVIPQARSGYDCPSVQPCQRALACAVEPSDLGVCYEHLSPVELNETTPTDTKFCMKLTYF